MVRMRRPCFSAKHLEVRHPGHRPVVVHDLADDAGGREVREAREVDRALRLPGAHEHAALAGSQRKDVTGRDDVFGLGLGVGGDADRVGAIGGADARGHARVAPRC